MEAGKNGSIDIGASTCANNKSKLYPKKVSSLGETSLRYFVGAPGNFE